MLEQLLASKDGTDGPAKGLARTQQRLTTQHHVVKPRVKQLSTEKTSFRDWGWNQVTLALPSVNSCETLQPSQSPTSVQGQAIPQATTYYHQELV